MMGQGDEQHSVDIASYIDHTYLKPDATSSVIDALCNEAIGYRFYSVCVNGMWVDRCRTRLEGTPVHISAVCGFPLGAMQASVVAYETAKAAAEGANEIDMVLPVGAMLDGDLVAVESYIAGVVHAAGSLARVKVILETGLLTDEQKRAACRISEAAGAHYVKTSTGFGPGGATVADIRLMRESVSTQIGVKASGGVRDYSVAMAMINAGATRIGTSSGIAIVQGAAGIEGMANNSTGLGSY